MWTYNQTPVLSDELYHHGVIGMKWGVRLYQNKDGTRIKGSSDIANSRTAAKGSDESSSTRSSAKSPQEHVASLANRKVSSMNAGANEDAVSLAITAVAYLGISYAIAKLASKQMEKSMRKSKGEELENLKKNKEIQSLETAPKLSKNMSPTDNMKEVNRDFPSMGSTMNCTFCTTAMALREKGYNVKASKTDSGWPSDDLFKKTFNAPEVKLKKVKNSDDLLNKLSSNGDGSYGNLTVQWKLGGGHSIFWKNEGGSVRIYDAQSNDEITKDSVSTKKFVKSINHSSIVYNRLDNCQPTEYALAIVKSNE